LIQPWTIDHFAERPGAAARFRLQLLNDTVPSGLLLNIAPALARLKD
jgi:hypothetical protein